MVGIKVKGKSSGFFDTPEVIKALGKANADKLLKFGAMVRRRALKSIAYADGPSTPGSPPHAHKSRKFTRTSKKTGKTRTRSISFLREFLHFRYDKSTKSVVIGPKRLDTTVDPSALPALEYGGMSTILDHGKKKRVMIKPRPFMGPAYEAEKPNLVTLFKDSVR